jgi:hypothetical protein
MTLNDVAAQMLKCEPDDVIPESFDIFGFPVFFFGLKTVVLIEQFKVSAFVDECVFSRLYTYDPKTIAEYTFEGATDWMVEAIKALQKGGEAANCAIRLLLRDEDEFSCEIRQGDIASYVFNEIEGYMKTLRMYNGTYKTAKEMKLAHASDKDTMKFYYGVFIR